MNLARRFFAAKTAVAVAAALAAGSATGTEPARPCQAARPPDKEVTEFLLSTAASEFRAPGPVNAIAFRGVRIGYFADTAPGRYVLCGAVQSAGRQKQEWIRFATIQTSPYEQWLGGVAESICGSKKIKWLTGDLSADLHRRVRG